MGMFDTLYIKKKLPLTKELKALNINWEEKDFQTKDLENLLDVFEITKTGKLRHLWQERKWKDDDDSFLKGYFEVVKEEWRDVPFHGTINFYTSHCTNDTKHWDHLDDDNQLSFDEIELICGDDWWIEFDAIFTKGKLEDIRLLKAEKTPVRERIYNNKVWAMKRAEENKKLGRRVVSFLRKFKPYRELVRFIIATTNKTHSKLTHILYRM